MPLDTLDEEGAVSRSVNKLILVGHAGRDPEIRELKDGTKVANLPLATNRRRRSGEDDGEERTDWHRLVLWEGLAELAENYISSGDRLYVEGRLEYGTYERDGVTVQSSDVRVRELVLLTPPGHQDAVEDEAVTAEMPA